MLSGRRVAVRTKSPTRIKMRVIGLRFGFRISLCIKLNRLSIYSHTYRFYVLAQAGTKLCTAEKGGKVWLFSIALNALFQNCAVYAV